MLFIIIVSVLLCFIVKKLFFSRKTRTIENKHVVITGGSSGIGKSLAILSAQQGAHVTIIARNPRALNRTVEEIRQVCINVRQRIQSIPLDVCDYDAVAQKLSILEETSPPIFMLINCAGLAICGRLEDMSPKDIKNLMEVNYFGTVFPIKAVLTKMKLRKNGIIVITASQAGLCGIYGMAAYAGSKFALRGLAEAIDMEVNPYDITVTVALPADTNTPGFENENRTKPLATMMISENGGLFHPDEIAERILVDALNGKFYSTLGMNSFILGTLCVGFSPFASVFELMIQVVLLGPLRLIGAMYLSYFHMIINKCIQN